KNEGREAFLFCPNSHYSGKKTDYQTNKQKKTNIKRDVCLHSEREHLLSLWFIHCLMIKGIYT
ncbi:hypothetical protein ACTGV6_09930, partial [Streptococcus suis]